MSVTANACPACTAPVPYGRLSCPACGQLLASVAGPGRRTAMPSTGPAPEVDLDAAPTDSVAVEAGSASETDPLEAVAADPSWAVVPGTEPMPESESVAAPVAALSAIAEPSPVVLARADASDSEEGPLLEPEPESYPARPAAFVAASAARSEPGPIVAPPASLDLPPAVVASFAPATPIPPSAVHQPGSAFAAAGALSVGERSTTSRRGASVSLPALKVGRLPEQLVVAGAGVAAVSFALPWGSAMIGAPSIGQPWITLGIMGSWHIMALAAVLGTAVLAVRGTRFGPWFRIGVVPLLVCGDLLGLAWPYLTTSLGRGIGVYAVLVGAIAMGIGAVLALRAATRPIAIRAPERNAAPAPTV